MDNNQSSSKRTLPNTPRVNDKIMEYYAKYGHGRDLEKFMRLYSPASSQESQNTQDGISSAVNKEAFCAHAKSENTICSGCCSTCSIRPLNKCCKKSSKSLPNIGGQHQNDCGPLFPAKDMIVDINVEAEDHQKKIMSISSESLETPKKNFNGTKTRTPDSIAKSHRRLEWDSLGDIGYQKSMSTSNISVLEKSLLKEFFREDSIEPTLEPATSTQPKSEKIDQQQIVKQTKAEEIEHNTPPLASSTLVNPNNRGAKPKKLTKSTSSTSLQEKFEKFAQTSLRKLPTVSTKEVQCSMSCSSNSLLEGTVTPSSFEYVSSRSSKSHSSKSSNAIFHTTHNVSQQRNNICEHPFITSITELLIKRKVLAEKNQQTQTQPNNIQQLNKNFKSAFDENKENETHSSTSVCSSTASSFSLAKKAPELDLGIQLICSLIDAKSVNGKQKKRLIRDIVKRLSKLEVNENLSHSSTDNSSAVLYDSVRSSVNNKQEPFKMAKEKVGTKSNVIPIPIVEEQFNVKESTTSNTNTTESSKDSYVLKSDTEDTNKSKSPDGQTSHHHRMIPDEGHSNKNLPSKAKHQKRENISNENNTNVPRLTSRQIEQIKNVQERETCDQRSKTTSETKTKRSTFTKSVLKSQQVPLTPSNTSSSSSLTTQKFIGPPKSDLNNSNTDAEQATMREWLNPLTQSEIDYEEKKRNEIKKKEPTIQKQKLLKKMKHDCGRVQQLNWIENEIRRLECLKHLLLKDVTTDQSSCNLSSIELTSPSDKNSAKDSTKTYKLYDTVYSDKSSVLSENAERLVQEIEIILEESHEDVINLKDNLKKSKNRIKETQILFEKHNSSDIISIERKVKPTFRSVKETININEEQVLTGKGSDTENKQKCQREKIDTPSTEESQNSESLKEMVQQKKKEFIEAYKTKKQHHYEALKQQQKEHFKYLNIERKIKDRAKPSTSTSTTDTDHYSVPLTEGRKFNANNLSYAYTQNPLPLTPSESENLKSKNLDIIYSTTANLPPPKRTIFGSQSTVTNPIIATASSSSTSMFCISSDVSVPMGSGNTSSTPTTTHQYDDVAAAAAMPGIAIQTSDSMLCTKPIYGSKQRASFFTTYNIAPPTTTTTSNSTTACIQVKPKGIAYVIEFENDKKNSNSNSTSNSDINTKSKSKTSIPTRTDHANNVKASTSTNEPQLTLQEHLEKRKPLFLQHSKERKAILNQLQHMREERGRQIREIINNSSFNSLDKRLKHLPPPPIQKVRILKTKEMKALTNKRFSNLSEVVAKQEHEIEQKKRESNRILRDVFNRRLQKRVRSGKLSLNHSRTVI
ncbi:hypothetical protein DOY81_005170 [Sarcophaga bullata]|nr:hypothetical protein DOY81_005170 [Sarcophaga bullata]